MRKMNKGFSQEWEDEYKRREASNNIVSFPWSDVVSHLHRYCSEFFCQEPPRKILELGCGTGANIPLFLSRGFQYVGIDGSDTAIKLVRAKFSQLTFIKHDFTTTLPFEDESFDLILDRGSITYVETASLENMFQEIYRILKKGGLFLCVDLFSKEHPSFLLAEKDKKIDGSTILNPSFGSTSFLGSVRFWDYNDILTYFKDFKVLYKQHKKVDDMTREQKHGYASYDIIAKKE